MCCDQLGVQPTGQQRSRPRVAGDRTGCDPSGVGASGDAGQVTDERGPTGARGSSAVVGAIVDALDAAAVRALGDQAGRSGAPPVKWLILRVLGDVTSASSAELAQALGVRDDLYRADDWVRASLALRCREIGLWPDTIVIEVICKDAAKTGLAVCGWQARPRWRWSLTASGRALFGVLVRNVSPDPNARWVSRWVCSVSVGCACRV